MTLKTRRPSHRMLKAIISHAKPNYTRLVQEKCVIQTFTRMKKDSRRDLLGERGNVINGLKDESLKHGLARQRPFMIMIEQISGLPWNATVTGKVALLIYREEERGMFPEVKKEYPLSDILIIRIKLKKLIRIYFLQDPFPYYNLFKIFRLISREFQF